MTILFSGISGLGGHLAPQLVAAGHEVVGISRNPSRVAVDVPVIAADATRRDGMARALEGVEVADFMIHSLEAGNTVGFAIRGRSLRPSSPLAPA